LRIFSLWNKRKEIMGEWRKTHDEELHNSYCSPNVSGMIKWRWTGMATFVARMGEKRNGVLAVGELEEKRPRGRPRRKRKENTEWMLKKQDGGHGMDLSG
jgi:hypothetical protein